MYVIVKDGKFYRVDVGPSSTLAHYLGQVKYEGNPVESTGLVFKNGLFYVTDNNFALYSFDLDDITDLTKISASTNNINDLASCPVSVGPSYGSVTLCKQSQSQRPLSGWNLQLLGEHLQTIEVPTNTGTPVGSQVLDEGDYAVVAQ